MLYTFPDYYNKFSCIADRCEDTCCAGWQIVVDDQSLRRYHAFRGKYRKKLLHRIVWHQKIFKQNQEGRCAFLKENNLCEMYEELGPRSLCKTCRLYPRHIEEFENVREISLALSCPEVARILLNRKEKVSFLEFEREGDEEYKEFDLFFYSVLVDTRKVLIGILQDRTISIEERMVLCYGLANDIHIRVKSGQLFTCEEILAKYVNGDYQKQAGRKVQAFLEDKNRRFDFSKDLFYNLRSLETLQPSWKMLQREYEQILFNKGVTYYVQKMDMFHKWIEQQDELNWSIFCEQILVYFIFTYFCGAVYDEQVLDSMKAALKFTILIWNMSVGCWIRNEKRLDLQDLIEIVYRFSRELEHSDENLKKFWK